MNRSKNLFVVLLLVFVAIGLCFYVVFESRWFPGFILSQWLRINHPEIVLKSFQYQKKYFGADGLTLEGVRLILEKDGNLQDIEIRKGSVRNPKESGYNQDDLVVWLQDANFSTEDVKLKHCNLILNFTSNQRTEPVSGRMNVAVLDFKEYHLEELSSQVRGNEKGLHLDHLFAKAYGGNIQGEVWLNNFSMLSYDIRLFLAHLDLIKLRRANSLFAQVEGKLSGQVTVTGTMDKMADFLTDLKMEEGGKIKASLLSPLKDYIPESLQKRELERLMKVDGDIPVEKVLVQIKNVGAQTLKMEVNLTSEQFSLDLNHLIVDINLDAPIGNLFRNLKIFSSSGK